MKRAIVGFVLTACLVGCGSSKMTREKAEEALTAANVVSGEDSVFVKPGVGCWITRADAKQGEVDVITNFESSDSSVNGQDLIHAKYSRLILFQDYI